jgi:hypothetical protein
VDDVERELRIAQARGGMAALKRIGDDIHGKSQDRAPIEEGTLRGSGEVAFIVNGRRFEGDGAFEAALGYAITLATAGTLRSMHVETSYNTVYAARQHEELDWQHPLGGQAKYLESVVLEDAARYPAIIAAEQRRHLH